MALDKVRGASDDEIIEAKPGMPVGDLVGLRPERIKSMLGEPKMCDKYDFLVAPCTARSDWFYDFHHLPLTMKGGGLTLLLRFGWTGRCSAADWVRTQ